MRMIFVRHAEPDYEKDSLTPKGFREAELLGKRTAEWNIGRLYVSPLGRAAATAAPIAKATKQEVITLDWLREFHAKIAKEYGTYEGAPWDFLPSFWTQIDTIYDKDKWYLNHPMEATGSEPTVKEVYLDTCANLDKLLKEYGYHREGNLYRVKEHSDVTIVLVCHMAITFVMLSHLLGISFVPLMQGFFLPPSSVTVMNTEELEAGIASFRCQCLGDVRHLHENGEKISRIGYFAEVFQE